MSIRGSLLQLLADGRFHSGAWLGEQLGVSRNAIWKHIHFLQTNYVNIHAIRGRGYRLAGPLELLTEQGIQAAIKDSSCSQLGRIEILPEVDSTNRYLLGRIGHGAGSGDVCLAEFQSAGRGRRGREWISPFAANIYLSLLWRFPGGADSLAGLGLVIGVCVLRTIQQMGAQNVLLKWPNDLVSDGQKLAGILLEMNSTPDGDSNVVIGVGLNVAMRSVPAAATIDQPWIDLETLVGGAVSRNLVAASLIEQLLQSLSVFQSRGLAPFVDEWQRYDSLRDQPVTLFQFDREIRGIARGIDEYGALRIEQDGKLNRYLTGDVSVRVR